MPPLPFQFSCQLSFPLKCFFFRFTMRGLIRFSVLCFAPSLTQLNLHRSSLHFHFCTTHHDESVRDSKPRLQASDQSSVPPWRPLVAEPDLRAVSIRRRQIQTAESGRTGIVVAKPGTSATGRGRDGCNAYGNHAKSKQSVLEPNNHAESKRRALAQIRQL